MILEKIAAASKKRAEAKKREIPPDVMKRRAQALPKGVFVFEAALKKPGLAVICEIKRASPSAGLIAEDFPYLEIAGEYERAGADAVSVLTEPEYFMGGTEYLREIRAQISVPVLRKDFIVDEYQLYETKTLGADAVLLICALLETAVLKRYLEICDTLGLSALAEAHDEAEVRSAIAAGARVIGVNNRNLKTFEVDIANCIRLRPMVPDSVVFVAESGIKKPEDIRLLRENGVNAVLVGEALMRSADKKAALRELMGA